MPRYPSPRRYAQAVFQIALEHDSLDVWAEDLQVLAEIVDDPQVADFLDAPQVSETRKLDIINELLGDSVSPLAVNLVSLLATRGLVSLVSGIINQFMVMVDDHRGIERADVTTAVLLDGPRQDQVARLLGGIVGGEVIASQGIQARILGSSSTDRTIVGIGANPEDGASLAQLEKAQVHVSSEVMRLLRTLGVDSADADELKERIRRTPQPRRERVMEIMRKLQELEGKKTELLDSKAALRVKVDESVSKARIAITETVYTDVHFRFGDTAQIVTEDLGPSVFLWVDGKVRYRAP